MFKLRKQFGTRTLFVGVTLVAICVPLTIATVRSYRLASGSRFMVVRDTTDSAFDRSYRVAVLWDTRAGAPIAVAIERGPVDSARGNMPSFCSSDTWVRRSARTVGGLMDMRIDGVVVVPSTVVQVYSALTWESLLGNKCLPGKGMPTSQAMVYCRCRMLYCGVRLTGIPTTEKKERSVSRWDPWFSERIKIA